jgi:hypothetical protein
VGPWPDMRDRLNRILRGWSNYFGYGTRLMAYRAVDHYVHERVRNFLRRRWLRVALFTSRPRLYSGTWECCGCAMSPWGRVRELLVKSVGKPDARNGHVRFDERGRDTVGRPSLAARYRALPRLYAVAAHPPACMQDKCDVRLRKKRVFRAAIPSSVVSKTKTRTGASADDRQ